MGGNSNHWLVGVGRRNRLENGGSGLGGSNLFGWQNCRRVCGSLPTASLVLCLHYSSEAKKKHPSGSITPPVPTVLLPFSNNDLLCPHVLYFQLF